MKRSFFMIFLMLLLSILLFGCADVQPDEYEKWRISDEAEDLNGDRKIDRADYELFLNPPVSNYTIWRESSSAADLNNDQTINEADYVIYLFEINYQTWRNSDDAEDLNDDRKIDRVDYNLFLNPPLSEYEIWKESNNAIDLNDDEIINELDYALYLQYSEFVGTYTILNYVYDGSPTTYVGNKIYLAEFGQSLEQISFTVDINGDVVANIPSSTIASFGNDFSKVLEALNNVTLTRISRFLVGLDTSVTIDNVVVNVTLYLTEIPNGFTTTYVMNFNNQTGTISFDLIKG